MQKDIHYETFDNQCYVNVRIMETSPLYGIKSDTLPLFAEGKVSVTSSNTERKAPPSITLNKDFFNKWKAVEDTKPKPKSKSKNWYFSFIASDRVEADKVIDQIYELEGMTQKERQMLLDSATLLYKINDINYSFSKNYHKESISYLTTVSEIVSSFEFDPSQDSKFALNLKTLKSRSKKSNLSNFLQIKKGNYEGFAIKIIDEESTEVVVKIQKNKFLWHKLKYKTPLGEFVERENESNGY